VWERTQKSSHFQQNLKLIFNQNSVKYSLSLDDKRKHEKSVGMRSHFPHPRQKSFELATEQNRRQKVFDRGALRFFRGVWTFVQEGLNAKTLFTYSNSYFNLGRLGALFGEAKPTKTPRGDGTATEMTFDGRRTNKYWSGNSEFILSIHSNSEKRPRLKFRKVVKASLTFLLLSFGS